MRTVLVLLLLAATALPHGGMFRPPPGTGPGDPSQPGTPGGPTSGGNSKPSPFTPWESWWYANREPYLRLRQRIRERTVISGTRVSDDPFDRRALRDGVLVPVMFEAILDEDEEVRTSAAVALGKFRASATIPALVRLMENDKIKQVREAAMIGLVLMRDPVLLERFRDMALDRKAPLRLRGLAVLGLGFLGDAPFLTRLALDEDVDLRGSRASVEEVRACAALALGFTGARSAVGPLARIARDEGAPVDARGYAGSAICRLEGALAVPEMFDLLRDGKARLVARAGAAIAPGGIVGPEEHGLLDFLGKKAQKDRAPAVRSLLVTSLGRIGGERAATHLVAGMKDCRQEELGFYALALGISGHADAGEVLLDQLGRSKSGKDRGALALGLGLAGYRKAAPDLRERLEDGGPAFVPHAMVALGLLDDTKSIPLVQKIVAETNDPFARREGAIALALLRRAAAIPELVALMKRSKTTHERGAVAQALGLVGDEGAVEPLLEIYRDRKRQGEERAIALAALGRIGDTDDIPLLSKLARDVNPYASSDAVREALTIL